MAARKSTTLKLFFVLLISVTLFGCGGSPSPARVVSFPPVSSAHVSITMAANPNPLNCVGLAIGLDNFGGCQLDAYHPHAGRVWEFVDTFTSPHHLWVRQETAPGFDAATGIVWHYSKDNFGAGRPTGDDGMGYWCPGDPTAELYFGLTYKAADPAKLTPAGWYSTHQIIKCNGTIGTADVTGPGYLIIADFPGDTGPTTYSVCWRPGVWVTDPTAWESRTCDNPALVGWETAMGRDTSGRPVTRQSEGPQVLGCAPTGTLDCRFYAVEAWAVEDDDMQIIQVIDAGNVPPSTDPALSMKLMSVTL